MQGKIVKGISGFYYIHVVGAGIYECKAKGSFRNQKIKPLVGDNVEIAILDENEKKGGEDRKISRKNVKKKKKQLDNFLKKQYHFPHSKL